MYENQEEHDPFFPPSADAHGHELFFEYFQIFLKEVMDIRLANSSRAYNISVH